MDKNRGSGSRTPFHLMTGSNVGECLQVKVQTQPGWAKGLSDGLPKLYAAEGLGG